MLKEIVLKIENGVLKKNAIKKRGLKTVIETTRFKALGKNR